MGNKVYAVYHCWEVDYYNATQWKEELICVFDTLEKARNTVFDRFDQKKQQGNVCRYAKNGMCTNRKSVNFRYDCENPNACIRQSF